MAGNILNAYGSSGQSIGCTITSAGTGTYRCSTAVNNGSNLFTDALVQVNITTAGSGTSSTGYMDVYAYGSNDGGSHYSANVPASDSAFSGLLTNLLKLGRINVTSNGQSESGGPWSVAAAFGGSLPQYWGIVVDNETGATCTAGTATYQGVYGSYT